jgi:hypothetical protein
MILARLSPVDGPLVDGAYVTSWRITRLEDRSIFTCCDLPGTRLRRPSAVLCESCGLTGTARSAHSQLRIDRSGYVPILS